MVDVARRAAEYALLDQKTYDYFLEVLDQPPSGEGFEGLMSATKPW